jgi:mRNA-degrading endonuclease toxin of MazEF toxin-antitoxin module
VLEYLGEVTVAPITSTVRDIPSEVFLSKADGMPRNSRAKPPAMLGRIAKAMLSI